MNFFQKCNFLYAPHEIRNLETQLQTLNTGTVQGVEFRGEKYLNTFIATDAIDCPNLLSHGSTFRMDVLLPIYPKDMVVEGENEPHFSK